MGKPVRAVALQGFVAITDVIDNGDGTYDVGGFARPYQQVTVQAFDGEGGNPSAAVNAQPNIGPYGWIATVTPVTGPPICFVAQGADGSTSSCMYPPVTWSFRKKMAKKENTKKPVGKRVPL
jgi:hypothetical protein